jgi:hypothetical protein
MRNTLASTFALLLLTHVAMGGDANAGTPQDQLQGPVKVFILAGQSNMEGQGSVDHDEEEDYNGGKGNLVWSMKNSKSAARMKKLKNEKGEWVVRDDVQIELQEEREVICVVGSAPLGDLLGLRQHRRQLQCREVVLEQHRALGLGLAHVTTSESSDW